MLPHIGVLVIPGALVIIAARAVYQHYRAKSSSRSQRVQQRQHHIEHLLRLAGEIREVAVTIESDLAPFRSVPAFMRLQARARKIRIRADVLLNTRERLRDLPWFELHAQVATIHADHLHMVEMRNLADREIKDWRKHVRRETTGARSSWPFVSTPLTTSGLDL